MQKTRTSRSLFILIVLELFVLLFVFFLYTFLHEGGHALTGWLFGQSLTEFDVSFWNFSAHVGLAGGNLTQSQLAVRSLAGVSLPLLIWAVFICIIPRKATFTLEVLKLLSSMVVINTLLAWIILPVLFHFDKAPSDDVTSFLLFSQMPPLILAFIAFVLYAGGWRLFLTKIDGLRNSLLLFSTTDHEKLTAGMRTPVLSMASLVALCAISVVALNTAADRNPRNRFTPPQDFPAVAQIDLSDRAYSAETIGQFTLDNSTYVDIFLAIRDINTTYFDLSVIGPNEYSSIVLHGEGYNAVQDGGLWEQNLPAGTYQLVLTSDQSPGTASIYLKIH